MRSTNLEEIFQKAKIDYPIGTEIKCAKDSERSTIDVPLSLSLKDGTVYFVPPGRRRHQFVYADGKWAKIVKKAIINYEIY